MNRTRIGTRIATRVAWRPGQRLDARDLGDEAATESALRAAHVRGVHRACGVACGFEVTVGADARTVSVAAGLAYDGAGEELAIAEATSLAVPDWAPADAGKPFEAALELYRAAGESRARLRWTLALEPTLGACGARVRRCVLAAFTLDGAGGIVDGPRYAKRPVARALRRPAIAFGELPFATAAWQTADRLLWIDVDTSAARFAATPVYFVRFAQEPKSDAEAVDLSMLLLSVEAPAPAGFRLNAVYPGGYWRFKELIQVRRGATIEWSAFEPFPGCSFHSTQGACS